MKGSFIRVIYNNEATTLAEKAEFIYNKQLELCKFFDCYQWVQIRTKNVDFAQKEETYNAILYSFKDMIRRVLRKKVDDDYIGNDSADTECFYRGRKYDGVMALSYKLYTKGVSKYDSVLLADQYHLDPCLKTYDNVHGFIFKLIEVFNPKSIEICDYAAFSEDEILDSQFLPGWMTYFDKSYKLPALPDWVEVRELENGGNLLITTKDVCNYANEDYRQKIYSLLPCLQLGNA
jgi:hypothetical protein